LERRTDWTTISWLESAFCSACAIPSAMVKSESRWIAGTRFASLASLWRRSIRERMWARRTGAIVIGCSKPLSIGLPPFFWLRSSTAV
jgi:hypothetical protein